MKRLRILYCLLFAMCSCIAKKNIYGNYQYKGTSNGFHKEYILLIKKGGFSMSYKSQDASPGCEGQWNVVKDTLFLQCDKENVVSSMISTGYMNQRDYKLKIIDNKKLILFKENIILEKN